MFCLAVRIRLKLMLIVVVKLTCVCELMQIRSGRIKSQSDQKMQDLSEDNLEEATGNLY